MPRVRPLTQEARWQSRDEYVANKCVCLMYSYGVKQKEIASLLGVTEGAISHQFKKKKLTLETVLAVVQLTGADANKIMRVTE